MVFDLRLSVLALYDGAETLHVQRKPCVLKSVLLPGSRHIARCLCHAG